MALTIRMNDVNSVDGIDDGLDVELVELLSGLGLVLLVHRHLVPGPRDSSVPVRPRQHTPKVRRHPTCTGSTGLASFVWALLVLL